VSGVKVPREELEALAPVRWSSRFEFSYRTRSAANAREDWRAKSRRTKEERNALFFAWVAASKPRPPGRPVSVTFTRLAPRKLDDDNLASAFKAMRDELARALGLRGDGPNDGATWTYKQERAPDYRVRVEIECEVP
jgi:hypothetical protein